MRTIHAIAFAIFMLIVCSLAVAQSTRPTGESSSKISDAAPANLTDDEAFAGYQRITAGIKPPKAYKSPDPEYPKIPIDAEPNGVVVMLVGISTKGHVELVHVLRASNDAFQQSAVATVKTWRFSPAKKNGKPIPAQITVEMHFQK
jgi:TonB family protein